MGSESSLAAWALVLARVPVKLRFCTACLVSSGLRSAAFAATSVLELKKLRGQHADAFAAFLRQHGRRLSVLKVSFRSGSPTVPPFEGHSLQRLQLAGCTVQLQQPPDNLLASATQLAFLELAQVTVQGPEDNLSALAALPELQHLALQGVKMHSPDTPTGSRPLRLPGAALQALTGLRVLRVSSGPFLAQDALQHLSCLTKLQHLVLHDALSTPLSPASAPGFSALTALTSCSLYGVSVDPTVLLSCTHLLQLRLRHLNQHNSAVANGAMLLQLLSTLPSLLHLEVANSRFSWPQDPEAFSSFTASSALRHLQLEDCGLPPGIWHRAFPEGRQLCQLQKLFALDGRGDKPADRDGVLRGASLSSADIFSISSCCRALQQLAVTLQPDVSLSLLTTLTGASCDVSVGAEAKEQNRQRVGGAPAWCPPACLQVSGRRRRFCVPPRWLITAQLVGACFFSQGDGGSGQTHGSK